MPAESTFESYLRTLPLVLVQIARIAGAQYLLYARREIGLVKSGNITQYDVYRVFGAFSTKQNRGKPKKQFQHG